MPIDISGYLSIQISRLQACKVLDLYYILWQLVQVIFNSQAEMEFILIALMFWATTDVKVTHSIEWGLCKLLMCQVLVCKCYFDQGANATTAVWQQNTVILQTCIGTKG